MSLVPQRNTGSHNWTQISNVQTISEHWRRKPSRTSTACCWVKRHPCNKLWRVARCWGSHTVYTISSQMAVMLSVSLTGRTLLSTNIFSYFCPWYSFLLEAEAGMITSIEEIRSSHRISNPWPYGCSTVPQSLPYLVPSVSRGWKMRTLRKETYFHGLYQLFPTCGSRPFCQVLCESLSIYIIITNSVELSSTPEATSCAATR
jgi:hypothetical protein